jgi:hypothetical protein
VNEPDFYMASTEGYGMEEPRRCWRIRRLATAKRKDILLVKIDPPLPGQKYGLQGRDIDVVLVATRHQAASLFPITRWPVYVHVARLLVDDPERLMQLQEYEFKSVAWAELYRTEKDARLKVM